MQKTRTINGIAFTVNKSIEGAAVLTAANDPTKVYAITRRLNGGYNVEFANPPPEVWCALLEEFHGAERLA